MQVLWGTDNWLTVREIHDGMNYPPVAYTTVATVAQILFGKGLLRRQRVDRPGHLGPSAWWHRATRSAGEHIGEMIATLLDQSPSPRETLAYALTASQAAFQLDAIIPVGVHGQRPDV